MMNTAQHIAQVLLEIDAIKLKKDTPVTFKSGIVSPVYVDNRTIPFYPKQWKSIVEGFNSIIQEKGLLFDVIAGVETAGIPHSAALAYLIQTPSVFVRKQPKEHGLKNRIEGGSVHGKKVLLIEDVITTGGSSLSGVQALRDAGAVVENCLVIVSFSFQEALDAFHNVNTNLLTLTSFPVILEQAQQQNKFTSEEISVMQDWLQDPLTWAKRNGL